MFLFLVLSLMHLLLFLDFSLDLHFFLVPSSLWLLESSSLAWRPINATIQKRLREVAQAVGITHVIVVTIYHFLLWWASNITAAGSMVGTSSRFLSRVTCAKFGKFALRACKIPLWAFGQLGDGVEQGGSN